MAERQGCAVIIIRHLRKNADGKAAYRGMGSIDITAAARSVLLAARDPRANNGALLNDEASRFVIAQTKCNITIHGPSLAYSVNAEGLRVDAVAAEVTADDLLRSEVFKQVEDIDSWLCEQLSPTGTKKPLAEIKASGALKGFSSRQLSSSAKKIGVIRKPSGFGGEWTWQLPPLPEDNADDPSDCSDRIPSESIN
jgi:hypothetical protein